MVELVEIFSLECVLQTGTEDAHETLVRVRTNPENPLDSAINAESRGSSRLNSTASSLRGRPTMPAKPVRLLHGPRRDP